MSAISDDPAGRLALIGQDEADVVFPFVYKRLRQGQFAERWRAAEVLAQLGMSAQGALPLLEDLAMNDPTDEMKENARRAVRAIRENRAAIPITP